MAKRKRLSPLPAFGNAAPETRSPSAASLRAPIADMAGATAATSAASEMAEALDTAREGGRMVLDLALGQIVQDHLVRDRVGFDADEMEALKTSIAARGQQVPIEVTRLGPDSYGLISGWRRVTAMSALYAETQEKRFATVQAVLRRPKEAAEAYLAMVEENEIRAGLSYYERARIARTATAQGAFETEQDALRVLFAAASRARRSKIGSFLGLVSALDGALRFPRAIGERLGLRLAKALEEDPDLGPRLRAELEALPAETPEDEIAGLEAALAPRRDPVRNGPRTFSATPGVTVTSHNGRVTLTGAMVSDDLAARVAAWLKQTMG